MKYIIYWYLIVPTGCPDYKKDEFGNYPTTTCTVYHTAKEHYQFEFDSRDSALVMYNKGLSTGIKGLRFDSVIIKK